MKNQLHIVILEDSEADVELEKRELRRIDGNLSVHWVQDRDGFLNALNACKPQLLLLDYSLPGFDGLSALELAMQHVPETPAIIVSGAIGEERAIEVLKAGATDYVLKSHLDRLGPVIKRALREAEQRIERKRAEEALRESHERLKKVVENEAVGVMFWDLTTGVMTDANDTFLQLMGYSRSDVEAGELTWQKLTPPEYFEASQAEVRKFMVTGRVGPYEKEYLRKDGTRHWFVFAGSSLGNNACVEFCVDISARKQAEEALRERTEQLQTLLDTTPIPVFLAHDPACGKITGNRAAHALVELPPERNISKSAPESERPAGWQEMRNGVRIQPEDLPLQQAARGYEVRDYEMDLVFADGTAKTVLGNASPIRDKDGNPAGGVAILMDITDRKRAEEALRESEERFRTMADSTPVMIWVTNATGEVNMVNHAYLEFFGVMEAEIKPPGTWKILLHPEDQEHLVAVFKKGLQDQGPFAVEGRVRHRSGSWRWLRTVATPRFDRTGAFMGHVGTSTDITEEKRAVDALRASELNLRLMVNHSPDAMLVVSSDGTIEAVSEPAITLLGFTEGELVRRNAGEFAETMSRLEMLLALDDLRKQAPRPKEMTLRVKTKGGVTQFMSVTASIVNHGMPEEKYFVKLQKLNIALPVNHRTEK